MNIVAVVDSGSGRQVQRLSVSDGQRITLGRDWNSDIIVDDPYVDANHARLAVNVDGQIQIEDLSSANGTRVKKETINGSQIINVGDSIRLGDTTIQLYDAANEVEPTLVRSSGQAFLNRVSGKAGLFLTTSLALVSLLLTTLFGIYKETNFENVLGALIGGGMIVFMWCLAAGVISKLFRGETRITAHWALACLFAALTMATSFLIEVVRFNTNSGVAIQALETGVFFCLMVMFIALTFSLCTRLSKVKVRVLSCVLSLLAVLVVLLPPYFDEDHEKWTYRVQSDVVNQPAGLLWRTPTTLDAHLSATEKLFTALDGQVSESDQVQSPE